MSKARSVAWPVVTVLVGFFAIPVSSQGGGAVEVPRGIRPLWPRGVTLSPSTALHNRVNCVNLEF